MPNTKQRQIRCPDNIWMPAAERARREGTTISRVINDLLLDYGRPILDESHPRTAKDAARVRALEARDRNA